MVNQKTETGKKARITLNPDAEIARQVKEGLKRKEGYCPCRLERTEDTKCMCREFREQIRDPDYVGFCHCLLYYKDYPEEKKEGEAPE